VGVEITRRPDDYEEMKKELFAAGYRGERVVVLGCSTIPSIHAMSQVATDVLQHIGMNIDMQLLEWGSVVARRASRDPLDKGGWSIFYTSLGGMGNISPGPNLPLRASGATAWFGWPDDPKMEALREAWFEAPDQPARQEPMPQDAGGVLAEPVLCSARPVVPADRLPRRPTGCARRLAAILWCAAGVSPERDPLAGRRGAFLLSVQQIRHRGGREWIRTPRKLCCA
jgi:hypothetical protein